MSLKHTLTDAELICKCKTGDLVFQEILYKRFYNYALGTGMRYLINRDHAMEVVNDAFIKAFKALHTFKQDQEFKPWFRKILVNTALDYKRDHKKYEYAPEVNESHQQNFFPSVIDQLSAQDILKLLELLPEIQQLVFNLYEIDGYSHKEIGQLLNIAESSSRTYLTRAKQTLQKYLQLNLRSYERDAAE